MSSVISGSPVSITVSAVPVSISGRISPLLLHPAASMTVTDKIRNNLFFIRITYPFPIRKRQAVSVYRCPPPYGQTLYYLHGTHINSGLSRILCIVPSYGAIFLTCSSIPASFSVSYPLHMPCRISISTYLPPPSSSANGNAHHYQYNPPIPNRQPVPS